MQFHDNQFQPMQLIKKPAAITVFGVICIIFGGFGLLSILPDSTFSANTNAQNPIYELAENNETFNNAMKISQGLGIITSIVLVLIGIGILRLYPLARKAAVVYGFYSIISTIIMSSIIFIEIYNSLKIDLGDYFVLILIVALIFIVISMVFPVLLIIFMRRPNVIEAFRLGPAYFLQMQQQMLNQVYNYPPYQPNPPYFNPQMNSQNRQAYPGYSAQPPYPPYPQQNSELQSEYQQQQPEQQYQNQHGIPEENTFQQFNTGNNNPSGISGNLKHQNPTDTPKKQTDNPED